MPWDFSDMFDADAATAEAIRDMSPAMAKSATIIAESIDRRFEEEGDGESPWVDLRPRTVAERIHQGYGGEHPILQRTQALRTRATAGQEFDDESAAVGPPTDDDPIAQVHEHGGGNNIPARPYLRVTDGEADQLEQAVQEHLARHRG